MNAVQQSNDNNSPPQASTDLKRVGHWEIIKAEFEGSATHVALLPTNEVFAYGGSSLDDEVFENPPPAENLNLDTLKSRKISMDGVSGDLWCGGHTFLEDGTLLFVGGTSYYPPAPDTFYGGLREAYSYDPFNKKWKRLNNMIEGRWYPTLIRLADNSVLVVSGLKYRDPKAESVKKKGRHKRASNEPSGGLPFSAGLGCHGRKKEIPALPTAPFAARWRCTLFRGIQHSLFCAGPLPVCPLEPPHQKMEKIWWSK